MRWLGLGVERQNGGEAGAALEGDSGISLGSITIGNGGLGTTCGCGGRARTGSG
jgi:hypothetical protein